MNITFSRLKAKEKRKPDLMLLKKFRLAIIVLFSVAMLPTIVFAQAWVARHGMTSAQYQSECNKYVGQGYRLTDVSGYGVKGNA